MSLALLTTFYGLFFSLLLWTPLQNRIHTLATLQSESYHQLSRWIELLLKRKPVHYFESLVEKKNLSSREVPLT